MSQVRRIVVSVLAGCVVVGALTPLRAGASGASYGSSRALQTAIGPNDCTRYSALATDGAIVPTRGGDFGACLAPGSGQDHELFLAVYGRERNRQPLLLSMARFACADGEAELDRWHYVDGRGWIVGVDALAMGLASLGIWSYPPPEVTGTARLTKDLARRLHGTAHEVDCRRYQELDALDRYPSDAQIEELLAGSAPRKDQRD